MSYLWRRTLWPWGAAVALIAFFSSGALGALGPPAPPPARPASWVLAPPPTTGCGCRSHNKSYSIGRYDASAGECLEGSGVCRLAA